MTDIIETHEGIEILQDEMPENPRDFDNTGTMVCFHRRYNLGDEHDFDHRDFDGWSEIEAAILRKWPRSTVLPLYLFAHSGLTISTNKERFRRQDSNGWDWRQVGFIVATPEAIRRAYGLKRATKKYHEKARKILLAEVEEYDAYLRGDAYCIRDPESGDTICGYYGLDAAREGAEWLQEAAETSATA